MTNYHLWDQPTQPQDIRTRIAELLPTARLTSLTIALFAEALGTTTDYLLTGRKPRMIGVGWQETTLPEPVPIAADETVTATWTVPNAQYWDGVVRRVDEMSDDHVDALHREIRMLRARSTDDVWQRQATEIANMRRRLGEQDAAVARIRELHVAVEGLGYDCDEDDTPGSYGYIARVCSECGTSNKYGVRWPCSTIQALGPEPETT